MRTSPAQPEAEAASIIPPASAKEDDLLRGGNVLRSMSPSAADLSDSCSFASAESQDLDNALLEGEIIGRATSAWKGTISYISTQEYLAWLAMQASSGCRHALTSLQLGHRAIQSCHLWIACL